MKIYPRCKSDWKQIYISAEGHVMPCCWVGSMPYLKEYLEFYRDTLPAMSVRNRPLDEILTDPLFLRIEQSWSKVAPFGPCIIFCSRALPETDRKFDGTNEALTIDLTE